MDLSMFLEEKDMMVAVPFRVDILCGLILDYLNDMWRYNVSNNQWEHLIGNKTVATRSNYNVPYPGGVMDHAMSISGDFVYIFGGFGLDEAGTGKARYLLIIGYLNDLWRYDIANNYWDHITGDKSYSRLTPYTLTHPGGISSFDMTIIDEYIYAYGGYGMGVSSSGIYKLYSYISGA